MTTGNLQAVALSWFKMSNNKVRFQMLWIGLIIGLFVGANAGIVVAGMLFSAKRRDKVRIKIADKDQVDEKTSNPENIKRGSYQPIYNSEQIEKSCPKRTTL